MSNGWQEILNGRGAGAFNAKPPIPPQEMPFDGHEAADDAGAYQPWILQRNRSRPILFIDFRQFDQKTGLLIGCQMSYPHLVSVDYAGDCLVSLDFGHRQFIIEGEGLAELPMWLQQGVVLSVQEFSTAVWQTKPQGPIVKRMMQSTERRSG